MVKNLDKDGLKSIAYNYDLFFIDIWGVIHNGIKLYENSVNVLDNLEKIGKEFILLTNAPRPNKTVEKFLQNIGLDNNKSNKVFTSGEATLDFFKKELKNMKFYHIGPSKDFDLFELYKNNKTQTIEEAEFLLCTGLFENHENDIEYYKNLFLKKTDLKMVCTNPDLVIDRGDKRELCAGSIAKTFFELGGKIDYFGKPYSLVYKKATDLKNKKVLCIGDNLNTDIKGANNLKFDSLLITNGIHKMEINSNYGDIFKKYKSYANFIQSELKW
tara:strand:+ start:79 stop:894 length:816 start_codon:yes stop_codon:yes gene_type:complete